MAATDRPVTEFAPAKINLTLHVTGRREDGYHLLDSLVVFADVGDTVRAEHAPGLTLEIDGPEGAGLATEPDNLVLRAARLLGPGRGAGLTLTKRLPVASGIGGGSADAAAALRALGRLWGCGLPEPADLLSLGADVPACVASVPCRMYGIGEKLAPVPPLPGMDVVLVNPRFPVSTPAVFSSLKSISNPPMPEDLPNWRDLPEFAAWLQEQRNDLLPPAAALTPAIAAVLAALDKTGCLFAGMSGSGATCFGLFPPDLRSVAAAHTELRRTHPDWWSAQGRIL